MSERRSRWAQTLLLTPLSTLVGVALAEAGARLLMESPESVRSYRIAGVTDSAEESQDPSGMQPPLRRRELTPEEREQLMALGYVR